MTSAPAPTVIDRDLFFEDFASGQIFVTDSRAVGEAEILAFGKRYADQPYHTDPEAAKSSIYGGLIAPGYMTAAITFGLFADLGVLRAGGMGSPGVDKLRWHKPVRAGDTLHVVAEVAELSPAGDAGRQGRHSYVLRHGQSGRRHRHDPDQSALHQAPPRLTAGITGTHPPPVLPARELTAAIEACR